CRARERARDAAAARARRLVRKRESGGRDTRYGTRRCRAVAPRHPFTRNDVQPPRGSLDSGGRSRANDDRSVRRQRRSRRCCRRQVRRENFEAVLSTCRLAGAGTIEYLDAGSAPSIVAAVRVVSDQWQKMLGMDSGWDGVLGGRLTLDSPLQGSLATLSLDR